MNTTYYTVYKVTNKVNGKVYIGCHKTRNLDDGYMGSGKYLKKDELLPDGWKEGRKIKFD